MLAVFGRKNVTIYGIQDAVLLLDYLTSNNLQHL